MSRGRLYTFLMLACLAAYAWLGAGLSHGNGSVHVEVCLFKRLTGFPCPSCGSTRAILAFLNGNFSEAFHLNPLGILLLFILCMVPPWILMDLAAGKQTLLEFYRNAEAFMKQKRVFLPAILLVLANWGWNISKGL